MTCSFDNDWSPGHMLWSFIAGAVASAACVGPAAGAIVGAICGGLWAGYSSATGPSHKIDWIAVAMGVLIGAVGGCGGGIIGAAIEDEAICFAAQALIGVIMGDIGDASEITSS